MKQDATLAGCKDGLCPRITSCWLSLLLACPLELTRKHVSEMFFRGEVEEELRDSPVELETVRFKSDSDIEIFMENVEEGRVTELYPHQPNERCIKKGLYVYIAVAIVVIHGSHAVLYKAYGM